MNLRFLKTLAAVLLLCLPLSARADRVTVFAAASLKTVLDDIAPAFETETGNKIVVSLAGSSALARQIQLGAPADVFISANTDWMDLMESDGLLVKDSRFDLAGNHLVVIAPADQPTPLDLKTPGSIAARLGEKPLAMALVNAVPAGIYGKVALENLGHWPTVQAQVAQTDNVRAALALVAAGETPLGIVYATDAMADPNVVTVAVFPPDSHPSITYPAAAIAGGNETSAAEFLTYLQTEPSRNILSGNGFLVKGQ